MLDSVRTSCSSQEHFEYFCSSDTTEGETDSAIAQFYDELCLAVRGGRLAHPIKEWIMGNFSELLEESFLGDIVDDSTQKPSETEDQATGLVIADASDRAIIAGTSANPRAPTGAMRFNIDGEDALVYCNFLSLAASNDPAKRMLLPQLCPLLRLLAACHDRTFGGDGLGEIDAIVGCPLFLPTEDSVGIELQHLSADQQLAATTSVFHAASWCREIVNLFIRSAAFPSEEENESQIATTSSELRQKIVFRLKALIEIQDELHHASSKCPQFTPPGFQQYMPPKELIELQRSVESDSEDDDMNEIAPTEALSKMTKEQKEMLKAKQRASKKKAAVRARSKSKLIKMKAKYETSLAERSQDALQPLSSFACLALGFPECSVIAGNGECSQNLSMDASDLRKLEVGGPLTNLLLSQLQDTIDHIFPKKRLAWLSKSSSGKKKSTLVGVENPYQSQLSLMEGGAQTNRGFEILGSILSGHVFVSIYEHLATIAEIRGGGGGDVDGDDGVDGDSHQLKECASLLFSCLCSILNVETLTSSSRGRCYLQAVMKQLSLGERESSLEGLKSRGNVSLLVFRKSFSDSFTVVEEIIIEGESDDLAFVMGGVVCLEAIIQCACRLEIAVGNADICKNEGILCLRKKLSDTCHKFLQRRWAPSTKYNKNTVGKLVSLYIDNSFAPLPEESVKIARLEAAPFGRLAALTTSVNNILRELSYTKDCKGPVEAYPTCSSQSFGSYLSAVMNYIPKDLEFIIDSPLSKSNGTIEKVLEYTLHLVDLLKSLFGLTKENPQLAKRPYLLTQLRFGTIFMETFVAKAVPFLQTNFSKHDKAVFQIIKSIQMVTRQMGNVINHGKRAKDANIIKEAPRAKKILEIFLHKIKVLMQKNKCVTALWSGTLKEKHIDGTVVEKSDTEDEETDDDEEDDEGDDDDDDDDDNDDDDDDDDDDEDGDIDNDDGKSEEQVLSGHTSGSEDENETE